MSKGGAFCGCFGGTDKIKGRALNSEIAEEMPVDRLSNLPDSLISSILSSLPTKEAVATSILASSWRFHWTNVTSLDFSNRGGNDQTREDFAESVDMVMRKNCSKSIDKLCLVWESANFQPMMLKNWVDTAIDRNVKKLNLQTVSLGQCEFELPPSLYASRTLKFLTLEGAFLIKPPSVVCLPRLASLALFRVLYESDESLPAIISGCPALESVSMEKRHKGDNMAVCVISSPVVKHIFFSFRDEFVGFVPQRYDIDLYKLDLRINAPALESLSLHANTSRCISIEPCSSVKEVTFDPPSSCWDTIFELLRGFASVELLKLDFEAIIAYESARELMARDERATSIRFEKLARLVIFWPARTKWNALMHLLDGCVRLEELGMWFESNVHVWSSPARVPECLIKSLKCVMLEGFRGKESMAMLKFFLENGLVLEKVNLFCGWSSNQLEILNEVSQFPRASPACEISCLDCDEFNFFY